MIQLHHSKTAVVTGAAGGFGQCFARQLLSQGYNLILVDRREPMLHDVANKLSTAPPVTESLVSVRPVAVDLSKQDEVEALVAELATDESIEFLINNAGFAHLRNFTEIDVARHLEMVALHVSTPMQLIHALLPGMIQRDSGTIINVSSLGAWLPAGDTQYAATKSYLLVLSQALNRELKGTGVRVQALCPSFVDTGFHNTSEMSRFPRELIPRRWWMQAEEVISCCLRGVCRNQDLVIPGWRSRLLSVGLRSPWINPIICRFAKPSRHAVARDSST